MLERTFSNGFELIVHPTNAPVAALQVWVDVGSIDERPAEAGYCHFLEHMLFKGTQKRSTADIAGAVESAGGEMNAFTSFEYTVYHITISNRRWDLAHDILADMVLGSVFKPSEFFPEQEVILEEIRRSDDSPERQLYRGAYEQIYGGAGYGRPVIGFPRTVKKCSPNELKNFWKRWYKPSLMTLVVVGDVPEHEVLKRAEKTWGKSTDKKSSTVRNTRRRTWGFNQKVAPIKLLQEARSFPVNAVKWVGTLPACNLRDTILPALDVSSMALGQGETSRLYRRLFRDEQLVTSVGAGVWAPAGIGMYSFDAEIPLEKATGFRKSLLEEIDRFCKEGPSEEELERAKFNIESERTYSQQNMEGIAHRLGYMKTSVGNVYFDLEYSARVQDLTREDVKAAARLFLTDHPIREFALVPTGFESRTLWSNDLKVTVKKTKTSSTSSEILSLSEGLDLILLPRSDVPTISFQAAVMGGLRAETKTTVGIGNVLSDIWEKAPQGWSTEKFAEFLEGKAVKFGTFSGRNSLGASATLLTSTVDEVLPVIMDTIFHPALDEKEFNHERQVALEDIRTFDEHLDRLVMKLFLETLFENHPYAFPTLGLKESVEKLTHQQVKAHFENLMKQQKMVVSISGKFNRENIIKIFEKHAKGRTFGKSELNSPLSINFPKTRRLAEIKKNREQSHIVIGFPGLSLLSDDRHTLRILTTVLGGQSGRLFTEIRDKQALCYTVSPMNFEGIEPGYFGVYIGCDPKKINQAIDGIHTELQKLVTKKISKVELQRAVEYVSGRHFMDMQMNSSVATASCFNALYGLGYDEHLKLDEQLKAVNIEKVQKLAEKLFNQPPVTAIIL